MVSVFKVTVAVTRAGEKTKHRAIYLIAPEPQIVMVVEIA
jgi:hypothetical protein